MIVNAVAIRNILRNTALSPYLRAAKNAVRHFIRNDTPFPTRPYRFTRRDASRIYAIIRSDTLCHTSGTEVKNLEKDFASYHHTRYALATNSGTTALEMAVKAIGIMPGDEVIVPAYTFVSTAQAVLTNGGIPVFADIDDTYTIDPVSVRNIINKKTRAIIPVHIFGNPANMDAIMAIAKTHRLRVIEDACQAIGASYKNRRVGSIGDIGCFSFNEKKAINTGQGGMLIMSDKAMYQTSLDTQNTGNTYTKNGVDVVTLGTTNAMTEMQAALARRQLRTLDVRNTRRKRMYAYFIQQATTLPAYVHWYRVLPNAHPSYSRLVWMIDFTKARMNRETFIDNVRGRGIPVKTFYPAPIPSYSLFTKRKDLRTGRTYPFSLQRVHHRETNHLTYARQFSREQVGIEFSPYLSHHHIDQLITAMTDILPAA